MKLSSKFAGDKFKNDIISQINSGELSPGEAILSERKLAEEYGIGYMTVRRAVDDLVKEGLLYREPRKGTFVNRKPSSRSVNNSKMIALIISDLRNQFSNNVLEGVEKKAREHGFQLLVCNSELDVTLEASHLKNVVDAGVSGIILSPCFPPINSDVVEEVKRKNIPLVMIDKYFDNVKTSVVTCDNFDAAYRAVKYLISLGHRKIGHITSHASLRNISSIRNRFDGYCKALNEAGLELNTQYIQELDEVSVHTEMSKINLNYLGYGPMKNLLSLPDRPSAVFLLFDSLAVGAYRALKEVGLTVPDDMSLMGFDNTDYSSCMDVPLTTMAQPVKEIGSSAAAILVDRINGSLTTERVLNLKTQMITRNSCGIYLPDREAVTV